MSFYIKAHTLLICFCCFVISQALGQDQKVADSLFRVYQQKKISGIGRFELLTDLSFNETRDLKMGLKFAEELISLSKESGNTDYLRKGYFLKGTKKRLLGLLDEALDAYFKSAEIAKGTHHADSEGEAYGAIADIYAVANNYQNAMLYYNRAIVNLRQSRDDSIGLASVLSNAGETFFKIKNLDSALLYFNEAKVIFERRSYVSGKGYALGNIGMVYASMGQNDLAEENMDEAIRILEETQDYYPICVYLISIADVYVNKGDNKRALNYSLRSLHLAEQFGLKEQIADANLKLSLLYERTGNIREALKYYKTHIIYRDSLNNIKTVQRMGDLRTNYEVSQKQIEVNMLNQQKTNEKKLSFSLAVILGLAVIILVTLLRNIQNKQKAYKVLNLQKQETESQKAKAEKALNDLKTMQKQLIQSAKMASLGELTAGIAHEIQNPLNFVNNFSEINRELIRDLKTERLRMNGERDEKLEEELFNTLAENEQKISHHGKRADAIVKDMLLHSGGSSGRKELTDINLLANEYLRLAYHGFRVKNKDFNVKLETNFDESISKIEIVRQDMGRVLLNLFNNAFYAVDKKRDQGLGVFEPVVSVTTKKTGNKVELSIKDNGVGISPQLLDKIFQPFFTTKPTGQGTGLGLSLSYDIVKANKGELKVETKEGEFTMFIIELPANNTNQL
jgi:two-component system, NtrC family, sensor kinase